MLSPKPVRIIGSSTWTSATKISGRRFDHGIELPKFRFEEAAARLVATKLPCDRKRNGHLSDKETVTLVPAGSRKGGKTWTWKGGTKNVSRNTGFTWALKQHIPMDNLGSCQLSSNSMSKRASSEIKFHQTHLSFLFFRVYALMNLTPDSNCMLPLLFLTTGFARVLLASRHFPTRGWLQRLRKTRKPHGFKLYCGALLSVKESEFVPGRYVIVSLTLHERRVGEDDYPPSFHSVFETCNAVATAKPSNSKITLLVRCTSFGLRLRWSTQRAHQLSRRWKRLSQNALLDQKRRPHMHAPRFGNWCPLDAGRFLLELDKGSEARKQIIWQGFESPSYMHSQVPKAFFEPRAENLVGSKLSVASQAVPICLGEKPFVMTPFMNATIFFLPSFKHLASDVPGSRSAPEDGGYRCNGTAW